MKKIKKYFLSLLSLCTLPVFASEIQFHTWTMTGLQAKYFTQSEYDKTQKGMDLDSISFGLKSYNKFTGSFLPDCPLFIEFCLAESDLDESLSPNVLPIYLMQKDLKGNDVVSIEEGLKDFVKNMTSSVISYTAQSGNNSERTEKGPGTPSYLGHLKFGFNTPYVDFVAGFNYAKLDLRNAVLWKTVDNTWDAGYEHTGGFNQFTLGSKVVSFLEEKTGMKFTAGFSPNQSADRRGTLYGHYGWVGLQKNSLVVDFQSNGMYDNGEIFYDSVEQDLILGAKDSFLVGRGKLTVAFEGLLAMHQKASSELHSSSGTAGTADYFGYSTDVFYRTGKFDGIKNIASQLYSSYSGDNYYVELSYKMRGFEASQLYVRENTDDGTFDLSEQLGVLNSQNIDLYGNVKLLDDSLFIGAKLTVRTPLENLSGTEFNKTNYWLASGTDTWYWKRCNKQMEPLYLQTGGAEFFFRPEVSYKFDLSGITLSAYADMDLRAYTYASRDENGNLLKADELNKYDSSESIFRLKKAGLKFAATDVNDLIKNVNVMYGFDDSSAVRLFNTLLCEFEFTNGTKIAGGLGLKSVKNTKAGQAYNPNENNPFAFTLGVSKKLNAIKSPVFYAQFVYNMDTFKRFEAGQDGLALDRANVSSRWDKGGEYGTVDAVDYYDGRAAVRCGLRWDI